MNGKLSPKTQKKSWQSLLAVILTTALLLGFVTPALSSSGSDDPSPTSPVPPSSDRLRELASQYEGIEFNSNYTGKMPATEKDAIDQLEFLASIKEELDSMPANPPPAPYDPPSQDADSNTDSNSVQGTEWRSCNAPIGNVVISLLTWFRVKHTVKAVVGDSNPWNISSVSEHSTAPISSGFTIGGILVQVNYDELAKWTTGPDNRYVPEFNVVKAFWGLWSRYHVHFSAGPFDYSAYNISRGCEIA